MLEICKITVKVIPNHSLLSFWRSDHDRRILLRSGSARNLVSSPSNGLLAIDDTGCPEPFTKNAQVHLLDKPKCLSP